MKKLLLYILLTQVTYTIYSQNKEIIYLDENYKEIERIEFQKKVRTDFFFQSSISNDTVVFKKLRFRELYGKLNMKNKHQLNELFHKRHNIDTTKVWVIHYKDSIPNVNRMPNKSGFIVLDSTGNEISKILTWNQYMKSELRGSNNRHLKKHVTSYEDFRKRLTIEREYLRNFKNIELLHFYSVNLGYPIKKDEYNWLEDTSQTLKRLFTVGMQMYKIIILHPDGNFYTITHSDSLDKQKDKINFKSFLRAKKRWLKEFNKLN